MIMKHGVRNEFSYLAFPAEAAKEGSRYAGRTQSVLVRLQGRRRRMYGDVHTYALLSNDNTGSALTMDPPCCDHARPIVGARMIGRGAAVIESLERPPHASQAS